MVMEKRIVAAQNENGKSTAHIYFLPPLQAASYS